MKKILVLHGPNLNLLGLREPKLYGHITLDSINQALSKQAYDAGIQLKTFQSNSEATLIEHIHTLLKDKVDYIIINPGAFTHTSIALRDALLAVDIPFIEIHVTNIYARESFRQHSYFSDVATGVICGFGSKGYFLALEAIIESFQSRES